ncbi:MAG: rhomboid family intramembrane serine protease [bacterium]
MPYYEYRPRYTSFGPPLSPGIKKLMIIIGVVFFLQIILDNVQIIPSGFFLHYHIMPYPGLNPLFGLTPLFFWRGFIWQPVTYIFLHGGITHIFFNLFALWMFGSDLEYRWGTRFFIKYFFITGIGAGLCSAIFTFYSPIPIIGASGAIYGILLAFALTYPDRDILLIFFPYPIKAKYFALIFGLIEFVSSISARKDGIAHMAHLGGMVIGYIYLEYPNILKKIRRIRDRNQNDYRKWH